MWGAGTSNIRINKIFCMRAIVIASCNPGKLRDFAGAASTLSIAVEPVPNIASLTPPREDAPTFEANACKKAEHYSRFAAGRYVLADDSGLEVDVLGGAPGVHSARYANDLKGASGNASDDANNARLLAELQDVPDERRTARFVCCIAVARNGRLVACFRGEVRGRILRQPQGNGGFGYDPVFYVPERQCSFAELAPEEKAQVSHRGLAFRKFLKWYSELPEVQAARESDSVASG
jgi:XTP/dITP diphosphohydrolase